MAGEEEASPPGSEFNPRLWRVGAPHQGGPVALHIYAFRGHPLTVPSPFPPTQPRFSQLVLPSQTKSSPALPVCISVWQLLSGGCSYLNSGLLAHPQDSPQLPVNAFGSTGCTRCRQSCHPWDWQTRLQGLCKETPFFFKPEQGDCP